MFSSSQGQTLSDLKTVKNNINIICSLQFVICINVTIFFCDVIDVFNSVFNTRFIIYGFISFFNVLIEEDWISPEIAVFLLHNKNQK